jgi:hypothetical protein
MRPYRTRGTVLVHHQRNGSIPHLLLAGLGIFVGARDLDVAAHVFEGHAVLAVQLLDERLEGFLLRGRDPLLTRDGAYELPLGDEVRISGRIVDRGLRLPDQQPFLSHLRSLCHCAPSSSVRGLRWSNPGPNAP